LKIIFNQIKGLQVRQTIMARGLRKRGHKLTPQRLAVMAVVQEAQELLTPQQVLERAGEICKGLGLTTVYRTLELLADLGFVARIHLDEGCHAYARVQESGGHHLVCQGCHRVVDFPCAGLPELIAETAEGSGFVVSSHLLEAVGLCSECR
jgi:Fur family ferric uptake transcriptional regulator